MIPILATATSAFNAQELMSWLGCLAFLLGIAVAIKTLFSKTPQPFRVQGETRMATWEELQAVKAQCDLCRADFRAAVTKLAEKLDAEIKEMGRQSSIARKSIYDTIREVEAVVHRIEGKME